MTNYERHYMGIWVGTDEETVVDYCDQCKGEIYKGEEIYQTDEHELVHEDCFRDFSERKVHEVFNVKRVYAN